MKPRGHRRLNYSRKQKESTVNVNERPVAVDENVHEVIAIVEEPMVVEPEMDESVMDEPVVEELDVEDDTIEIIYYVYGLEDDTNDDYSLDYQDENTNELKLKEFAKEE